MVVTCRNSDYIPPALDLALTVAVNTDCVNRAVRAQYQRYVNHVQKYLFSKYVNNAPGEKPYDIVPRELQREAVDWLGRNVMEAPLWLYPESVVSKLGIDYVDEIRNRQQTIIALLLSPIAVMNLLGQEFVSEKAYPVEEYFDDIFNIVWKPLTDKEEQQNSFRRQQQRIYIDFIGLALNPTTEKTAEATTATTAQRSDAILYIEQHLQKVEDYLKSQHEEGINGLHYKNLLLRVKKIRERYESGK